VPKDLLSKFSGWRNNDCGCNGQTPTELLMECEDVLTSLAKLAKLVKQYDEGEGSRYNGIVLQTALEVGRKINGQG